ncbi:13082_t:CDS:1, partial [Acaulospora colombiana]
GLESKVESLDLDVSNPACILSRGRGRGGRVAGSPVATMAKR